MFQNRKYLIQLSTTTEHIFIPFRYQNNNYFMIKYDYEDRN